MQLELQREHIKFHLLLPDQGDEKLPSVVLQTLVSENHRKCIIPIDHSPNCISFRLKQATSLTQTQAGSVALQASVLQIYSQVLFTRDEGFSIHQCFRQLVPDPHMLEWNHFLHLHSNPSINYFRPMCAEYMWSSSWGPTSVLYL